MGNLASRNPSSGGSRKVILWDGTVEEFEEPITVAELMFEHPLQVVVELGQSDSINGKVKPRPLPADQELDPNKLYLMLPVNKRGKPTNLSGADAHRLLHIANAALRAGTTSMSGHLSSSRFLPLFARVCAGPGMAAATERNSRAWTKESNYDDVAKVDAPKFDMLEVSVGGPEFLTRQLSGKGTWKPSLDTIIEKKMEKRLSHWLF